MPSGERIQFGPNVNFLFETHSLKWASPATISRSQIIFLSDHDFDDGVLITSWVEQQSEVSQPPCTVCPHRFGHGRHCRVILSGCAFFSFSERNIFLCAAGAARRPARLAQGAVPGEARRKHASTPLGYSGKQG